ncbi:DUF2510 domain-containing protein [Actinacidiphila paucisporea]|uniref:DUF2510 domain-containing protein n=1 Tax=Actinacidiphila paucisporea TaxID=310782 RepID=A0A1M7J2T3_9ACTN|nr:DUF2510 domain-containing protein [Actinacidiphila paucisporea]SHM47296.1 Protein of unknown function [Actinacidiphila paucisporea]
MTTTTPPGWYPEPGHTGNGPAMERWWDGSAWTEYTRTAPVPAAPQAYPGYPGYPADSGYPGYPGYPSEGAGGTGGKRTGTVVIALVASLVLIAAIVAGVLVLGKDDNKNDAKTPTPTSTGGKVPGPAPKPSDGGDSGGATGGSGGSGDSPRGDGKSAIDAYDAISLPVLDGWTGTSGDVVARLSTGSYKCPGTTPGTCSLGGVSAEPTIAEEITATTAEAAAKEDISKNAANAYSKDTYGTTTSHQQLKAGPVTVAGQQGYLVRWKVVTASGTKGYVESLVFPSPTTKQLVLVRFGFDITDKAPGLDVIDQITQGIKTDTSQGNGSTGGAGGTGV